MHRYQVAKYVIFDKYFNIQGNFECANKTIILRTKITIKDTIFKAGPFVNILLIVVPIFC
jgi:hypothetical protein